MCLPYPQMDDLRMQLGVERVPGTHVMQTPNMDKLVGKSLWFPKAQCQFAVCGPTRTSLLTSRRPDTSRMWDLKTYWRNAGGNFTTIPQYFKERGYNTVGLGKIFHPGDASGVGFGSIGGTAEDATYSWTSFWKPTNDALYEWNWVEFDRPLRPGCPCCHNTSYPEHTKKACSWAMVDDATAAQHTLPDTDTARQSQIQTTLPLLSKWRKIWVCDAFWSQHLGCWGQKHVSNAASRSLRHIVFAGQQSRPVLEGPEGPEGPAGPAILPRARLPPASVSTWT